MKYPYKEVVMDHTRHWDIITPTLTQATSVGLIGTGGIGAITALGLAKLGIGYLALFDDDTVEPENIVTQFLKLSDIGNPKVTSVATMLKEFSDVSGMAYIKRVQRLTEMPTVDILISTVDSIKARQDIWWNLAPKWSVLTRPKFYLDARMGAEVLHLYTVRYGDSDWYSSQLLALSDDMVPDEPCTAKSTIYTALFAGGHVVQAVKRIIMDQPQPKVVIHSIAYDRLDVSAESA